MRDHSPLRYLTPHERDVLAEFLSRLRERCGDQIVHVWLFGSKVRGDFDEESDVDLLVVARDGSDALGEVIGGIAYALSLEHGVLLCEHVVSAWRFAQMRARQEPLYRNVVREGVDLWPILQGGPSVARERRLPFRRRVHRGENAGCAGTGWAHRRPPGAVPARARSPDQ